MKTKYQIYLTAEERRVVINSLIDLRNNLISQGMYTDLVDELLIRISKAKAKRLRLRGLTMEITYTRQGDYLLPNLTLPEQDNRPIGLWGQQRLRYIKRSRPILYTNLLTKCRLNEYLADIDERAQKMYDELVQSFAKEEGCTEQLKATNQILWVRKMNNAAQRAREVVNAELICN